MQGSRGYAPRDNPNLRNSLRGLGFRAFWDVTGERNGTAVALKLVTERDPVLGYVYPPSGSYPMTAPSPAPGAPLYLDGLLYLLGGSVSRTYEDGPLTGVPGRSRILIHPANTEEDVEGCIGVGLRRGVLTVRDEDDPARCLKEKRAIVASQDAFRRFMSAMATVDDAMLTITWAPGALGA